MQRRVEEQKRFTQPVCENIKDGIHFIEYVETDNGVLEKTEHLKEVCEICGRDAKKGYPGRYVITAESRGLALQAASAIVNLRCRGYMDEEEEIWDFEEESASSLAPHTCLLLKQEFFQKEEDDMQRLMAQTGMESTEKVKIRELLSQTENLFVECVNPLPEEFADNLRNDRIPVIILWIKNMELSVPEIKRLMFEQDYKMIHVPTPKLSYYADHLSRFLRLCGYSMDTGLSKETLIGRIIRYRERYFMEGDIYRLAIRAMEQAGQRGEKTLSEEDFRLEEVVKKEPGMSRLSKMIGLEAVKVKIEKICAVQTIQSRMLKEGKTIRQGHHNLVFAGMPGTGKSEVAHIFSDRLAEEQVTNGSFVQAARCDLIGKYVGHTAPQIKKLFDRADGGILFIDEAGSLLREDVFTREAVTELVRYMEERPRTTVIFAAYPEQIEAFLELDMGLSSRISECIEFPSYNQEELIHIFRKMVEDYGYRLQDGCDSLAGEYLERVKRIKKDTFGNAREVRRLAEASIESYCYRVRTEKYRDYTLTAEDIREGIQEIKPREKKMRQIGFGFQSEAMNYQTRPR